MSVFDPLGLISPFTLKSKLLMQEIWRSGIFWDDKVRDEEYSGWLDWIAKLQNLKDCYVPRCCSPLNNKRYQIQLHVFCDASLVAYAAAAYLRFDDGDSPVHVTLIMAKSRVAPMKPLTVPRLELQAALLGSRLCTYIEKELDLNISKRYLWSDSTTVLRWIRSEPRVRQIYIAHRLGEINDLTRTSDLHWVPTNENPADDATRFKNDMLYSNSRWFTGPNFLVKPESKWPIPRDLDLREKIKIDSLELRKVFVCSTIENQPIFSLTIKLLGWQGSLVIARRVRKCFNKWRRNCSNLTRVQEIKLSENYWYRVIQYQCFEYEIDVLRKNKQVNKGSKIANLRPFLDNDQILRADGRVNLITSSDFNNNPVILDAKHFVTKQIIAEFHRRFNHTSNDAVLNELRQKYYIVGLRNALRSLVSRCIVCRLRRAKPQNPLMSALPRARVAFRQRPFSHCGMDYFGPMLVKIGRRREKRWGVWFTCMTTRAIHLELAHSLSTDSAIMALQRLSARRGKPLIIYSDNGTNFRGASKELTELIVQIELEKLKEHGLQKQIEWRFNPPDAPHMGGAWERLIRSVKISLHAILKDQAPSEEVLKTVLVEIEHSVNSRPLTHVSLDPRDQEALTPNHFLIGTSSGEIKLGKYDIRDISPRKQWRLAQRFSDCFWNRWLREYLPSLIPRKKWSNTEKPLQIGDIVLIIDFQAQRNQWKRGVITRVFPSIDGEIRVAEVHTSSGDYTRPARKLIKLLDANRVQN